MKDLSITVTPSAKQPPVFEPVGVGGVVGHILKSDIPKMSYVDESSEFTEEKFKSLLELIANSHPRSERGGFRVINVPDCPGDNCCMIDYADHNQKTKCYSCDAYLTRCGTIDSYRQYVLDPAYLLPIQSKNRKSSNSYNDLLEFRTALKVQRPSREEKLEDILTDEQKQFLAKLNPGTRGGGKTKMSFCHTFFLMKEEGLITEKEYLAIVGLVHPKDDLDLISGVNIPEEERQKWLEGSWTDEDEPDVR